MLKLCSSHFFLQCWWSLFTSPVRCHCSKYSFKGKLLEHNLDKDTRNALYDLRKRLISMEQEGWRERITSMEVVQAWSFLLVLWEQLYSCRTLPLVTCCSFKIRLCSLIFVTVLEVLMKFIFHCVNCQLKIQEKLPAGPIRHVFLKLVSYTERKSSLFTAVRQTGRRTYWQFLQWIPLCKHSRLTIHFNCFGGQD